MHTFLFFFSTKTFWLLQRKPQAERYSKTNEMKSNIVRAGIEKKKFDQVVSTTASVGELFSTECRTNMTSLISFRPKMTRFKFVARDHRSYLETKNIA